MDCYISMMTELKTIILCADDFGLNTGVSQGIIKLVSFNRLSAVSCMVNMPDFMEQAQDLLDLKERVQIGLHFNLTEGHFISEPTKQCFGLKELLLRTHLGWISKSLIRREFYAQLDKFIQIMGFLPAFVDGHQHVHQFPVIRQIILEAYEHGLRQNQSYIRAIYPAISLPQYQLKTRLLAFTGGKALQGDLNRLEIPHNSYFSGIYDFEPNTDYRKLFKQWLAATQANTLLMCHPSYSLFPDDEIAFARHKEFEYFISDEFLFDVMESGCRISKFGNTTLRT